MLTRSTGIDCLIIGHNEMDFPAYEETLRQTDQNSGAYRDLNMNFVCYNNRPYYASEVFNLFCRGDGPPDKRIPPLDMLDTFSATIACLGTFLNKHGLTFDYIHSFQAEKDRLAKLLAQENIVTIAITTTLYVSFFPVLEIIEFIRKYNRTARIVVGGPFVSTGIRTQDAPGLDYLFGLMGADFYVNSSQGEATLVKLIHRLKNQLPVEQVNNIYYKTPAGYVSTPVAREDNRLSENMVNWNLFAHRLGEHAAVRTSISCPFSCAFCGFPQHAGEYQTADTKKIEEELNQLEKIRTLKSIHFIDDTFNIPVKRFKEILRMIIKNNYSFKWHSYFRCQYADEEMVKMMKDSGCEGVFLGIESGSKKILNNMNKKVKPGEYLKGIELLNRHNIIAYGNFIIGFPGETAETVEQTEGFIEKSGLDFFHAQAWYCEPITPIWQERDKYKIKGESFQWSHATMDSTIASDLVEGIFLRSKKSLWVPQYNFSLDNIFHLVHRGICMERIRNFLAAFNQGIKEKLLHPLQKEMSYETIMRLKNFQQENPDKTDMAAGEKVKINPSDAEFIF